jgi:TolB-like protein/tetratricopeptide (TPR) repeat protein
MRALLLGVCGVVASARWLAAQCPDGTPAPCVRAVRTAAPAPNSVAVLPFENLARDTSLTLLAEGLADQISTNLGQVRRIVLTPPASVRFVLAGTPREPGRLARALGARWLVDGQLLSSRGNVRVSVQLIDAPGRRTRWTGAVQRPTDDLFAVISAVADSVATAIIGTLAPGEQERLARRPTASNAALADYTRGIAAMRRYDEPSVRFAARAFESAIAKDSTFADAWAGLAESLVWQDSYRPPRDVYPRARAAAERALALEPGSARALAALSVITNSYDWNPPRAESLSLAALRLDSTDARAWLYLADAVGAEGRTEEASRAYQTAVAADTLDEQVAAEAAFGMVLDRRTDDALALVRPWRARRPRSETWDMLESAALVEAARCASSPPAAPVTILGLFCAGRTTEARAQADSVAAQVERGDYYFRPDILAWFFAGMGDREAALRWLDRAISARTAMPAWLSVNPLWDPFRSDSRFVALLARVRPDDR